MAAVRPSDTDRPRWSLGPLAKAIEAEALAQWVERAPAGDRILYAEGPQLPRSMAAVILARELHQQGRVRLHQVRSVRGWDFVAVKIAAQAEAERDDAADTLLRMLEGRATLGLSCPTNAEVARQMDLKNTDAASYLFRKLVRAERIRVTEPGPGWRRIVTIASTGKRTGEGRL